MPETGEAIQKRRRVGNDDTATVPVPPKEAKEEGRVRTRKYNVEAIQEHVKRKDATLRESGYISAHRDRVFRVLYSFEP